MGLMAERFPEMHTRIQKKCSGDRRVADEFLGVFTPFGPSQPHTLGLCWTDLLVKYECMVGRIR
jgi:hypothetical protein